MPTEPPTTENTELGHWLSICPCPMSHLQLSRSPTHRMLFVNYQKVYQLHTLFHFCYLSTHVGANIKQWCCHCGQRPDDLMTESEPDNSPLAPRLGRVSPGPGSGSGGGPGVKPGSGWWHCCRACNQLSQIFRNHREDAPPGHSPAWKRRQALSHSRHYLDPLKTLLRPYAKWVP